MYYEVMVYSFVIKSFQNKLNFKDFSVSISVSSLTLDPFFTFIALSLMNTWKYFNESYLKKKKKKCKILSWTKPTASLLLGIFS